MAGEPLACVECDACGGQGVIKKLSNSPLLYLHCKSCGCDRRSGKRLQAKWNAAISNSALEDDTQTASNPESDEWQPTRQTQSAPQVGEHIPADEVEPKQDNPIKSVITITAVLLGIAGMLVKATRG
ncbi:hypothetical protein [Shewanella maritima]|uniref:hypothetical protein n=1 Tax=Shewanella maritima TaxID=2520507 RepID=UPI0037361AF2